MTIIREAVGLSNGKPRPLPSAVDNSATTPALDYKRMPFGDFLAATFDQEWLVDDLLVCGQPGLIAGAKKTLKTSLALDLAISLATCSPFLGTFKVPKAVRVGVMTRESGQATIQETAARICRSKELADFGTHPVISFDLPKLNDPRHTDALRRFVEEDGLEVLFLDPVYLAMPLRDNEASNLFAVGRYLEPLTELGERTGCTIILLHHNRKSSGSDFEPPELEDMTHAGFQEWGRQWILLGRRARFDADSPDGLHELWLHAGGSAGHRLLRGLDIAEGRKSDPGGRRWDVRVFTAAHARGAAVERSLEKKERAKEAVKATTLKRNMAKVRTELSKYPDGGISRRKLMQTLSLSGKALGLALVELKRSGEIATCEKGIRLARTSVDK